MLYYLYLGAVHLEDKDTNFNQYFEPTCHINKGASRITGLTINGLDLCLHGDVIRDTVPAKEGIEKFISWLQVHFASGCILLAHNGKRFDFPILKRYIKLCSISYDGVYGLDSREVFKAQFPNLVKYKMENLVQEFAPASKYNSHDALGDAQNLSAVIQKASKLKNLRLYEFLSIKDKDLYIIR